MCLLDVVLFHRIWLSLTLKVCMHTYFTSMYAHLLYKYVCTLTSGASVFTHNTPLKNLSWWFGIGYKPKVVAVQSGCNKHQRLQKLIDSKIIALFEIIESSRESEDNTHIQKYNTTTKGHKENISSI
jgi:hypothetical protein